MIKIQRLKSALRLCKELALGNIGQRSNAIVW